MSISVQSHRSDYPFLWHLCLALGLGTGVLFLPDLAFAATVADRPGGGLGCILLPMLASGNTGKALAAFAITVLNVGALLNKITWGMVLLTALGITLVFGAATIVSVEGVTSRGNACLITSVWPNR